MASGSSVVDKITQYDAFYNAKSPHQVDLKTYAVDQIDNELDGEIQRLEERVRIQRSRLESKSNELSTITTPASDPATRIKQLLAIKMAYDDLTSSEPDIPKPNSRVPTVLAADEMKKVISNSTSSIEIALDHMHSTQEQVKAEENDLSDAKALSEALDSRLAELESSQNEQRGRPLQERLEQIISSRTGRATDYNRKTKVLRHSIDTFVYDHLGAMLLAEELGGPVVGELDDVDDEMLDAGFSAQGKPRKTKAGSKSSRRQLRLDELWGFGQKDEAPEPDSDLQAACEDILGLVDALYKALQGTSESGTYVQLHRDSAAARFLVRAKIAQYHPRDARRMRLIDFGRELD